MTKEKNIPYLKDLKSITFLKSGSARNLALFKINKSAVASEKLRVKNKMPKKTILLKFKSAETLAENINNNNHNKTEDTQSDRPNFGIDRFYH